MLLKPLLLLTLLTTTLTTPPNKSFLFLRAILLITLSLGMGNHDFLLTLTGLTLLTGLQWLLEWPRDSLLTVLTKAPAGSGGTSNAYREGVGRHQTWRLVNTEHAGFD